MNLRRPCLIAGLLLLTGGVLVGCQGDLFPKQEPRSQYDRYKILRGEETNATQKNRYGGEDVLLRERLKPLGQEW